jgi:hypothetical protein
MQNSRERVAKALDALTKGLYAFVEREMKTIYADKWLDVARESFRDDRSSRHPKGSVIRWDAHALLTVTWDQWNRVFRHKLGQPERSLISELRDFRNRWAHQEEFSFDDTYRILDSVERLLRAVGAAEAEQVVREKNDLMRQHFSREARAAYRKSQVAKRKWHDFLIYLVCCLSLVVVIHQFFGPEAWYVLVFVVAVFGYLAYQRLVAHPPMYFGPHECPACAKIIYGDACPYCESNVRTKPDDVAPIGSEAIVRQE